MYDIIIVVVNVIVFLFNSYDQTLKYFNQVDISVTK